MPDAPRPDGEPPSGLSPALLKGLLSISLFLVLGAGIFLTLLYLRHSAEVDRWHMLRALERSRLVPWRDALARAGLAPGEPKPGLVSELPFTGTALRGTLVLSFAAEDRTRVVRWVLRLASAQEAASLRTLERALTAAARLPGARWSGGAAVTRPGRDGFTLQRARRSAWDIIVDGKTAAGEELVASFADDGSEGTTREVLERVLGEVAP